MTTSRDRGRPAVAIVDYGLSNIDSVWRAVDRLGARPYIVSRGDQIGEPDRIILPGIGVFAVAMQRLVERGLKDALDFRVLELGTPFLGICLGMQLLASEGTEGGVTAGLGWIPGRVERLSPEGEQRVPHMGWNEIVQHRESWLFDEVSPTADVYFVHSFHLVAADPEHVLATTPFGGGFVSAVGRDHILGTQFHPEKSQRVGQGILRRFVEQNA